MNAALPVHKTKIVATIGPASESPKMLVRLIRAGMDVARLNFSHGTPSEHAQAIRRIRDAARETGRRVAIMADLPGPKLRLGKIDPEPIHLLPGAHFTLTSEDIVGNAQRASMTFQQLPRVVKPGDRIFLNDGLVQLVVDRIAGNDVECTVVVGGELRSRKGLNLPGVDLGRKRPCLEFALEQGVDGGASRLLNAPRTYTLCARLRQKWADSLSLLQRSNEPTRSRTSTKSRRDGGIMIARGDLGVEAPIEDIVHSETAIAKTNLAGTTRYYRDADARNRWFQAVSTPSTDVANAILDGTDCVML